MRVDLKIRNVLKNKDHFIDSFTLDPVGMRGEHEIIPLLSKGVDKRGG